MRAKADVRRLRQIYRLTPLLPNRTSSALAASNIDTVAISIHILRTRIGLSPSNLSHLRIKRCGPSSARHHAGPWHTSTHSAAVSSAIRAGVIRTALWVEPAAGTTSSNAFNDTSQ
jgi:hypothetical protein